jgi:hypothetical protein
MTDALIGTESVPAGGVATKLFRSELNPFISSRGLPTYTPRRPRW